MHPQDATGPVGPPVGPPPAPRRRRLWPWILGLAAGIGLTGGAAVVVVLAVVAVVVLAVVAVAALAVFALVLAVTAPVSRAPEFVDALAADDDRAAYALLCERTRDAVDLEEFRTRYAPGRAVVDTKVATSGGEPFQPPPRLDATFVYADGTTQQVTYLAEAGPDGNLLVCDPPPLQ